MHFVDEHDLVSARGIVVVAVVTRTIAPLVFIGVFLVLVVAHAVVVVVVVECVVRVLTHATRLVALVRLACLALRRRALRCRLLLTSGCERFAEERLLHVRRYHLLVHERLAHRHSSLVVVVVGSRVIKRVVCCRLLLLPIGLARARLGVEATNAHIHLPLCCCCIVGV